MIFIHELGHFLSARASGVGVKEFAIGMGPKFFTKVSEKTGIRYSLRALPIGGFVSMVGEDEESAESNAFGNVSVYKRMIIIVAGAFMNIVLGFIIVAGIVLFSGTHFTTNIVGQFTEGSMSSQSGLMVGDRIVKVNNTNIHTSYELVYEISNQGYRAPDLTVIRDGNRIVLENVIFPIRTEAGATFGTPDFYPAAEPKTFGNTIKNIWYQSVSMVKMIWDMLFDLLGGRYGFEAVSGPVGITEAIGISAKQGPVNLMYLCALLTINLGVVNLLPLPALDGGRFFFLLIEMVHGKPVNKNVEAYIHFIGIILLFALMIIIAMKDIWGLFT